MKQRGTWRNTAAFVIAVLASCVAAECFLLARRDRLEPYRVREEIVWSEATGCGVLRGTFRIPIDESDEAQVFYAIPLGGDRRPCAGAEDVVFYLPRYGERGDLIYDDTPSLRKYVERDGGSFCSFRILRDPSRYPDREALGRCVELIRQWLTERYHLAPGGRCYLIGSGVGAEVIVVLCSGHPEWARAACVIRRPGEGMAGLRKLCGAPAQLLVVRQRGGDESVWTALETDNLILLETEKELLFSPLEELAYAFWHWARDRRPDDERRFRRAETEFLRRQREWSEGPTVRP